MARTDDIAEEQERLFRRAFLDSVQRIKDEGQIAQLQTLIERQDIDGIMRLLGIDAGAFSDVAERLRQSFLEGGTYAADVLSPIPVEGVGSVQFRFDLSAPSAVEWIRSQSSRLVTEVVDSQREMLREVVADYTDRGVNPRTTALDIVGRKNVKTGKREGGFIGLTSQQAGWISNAEAEIEGLDANYLNRELRDKRFDATFRKALTSGEPIPASVKRAMLAGMQSKTLKYRGDVIARTESINGLRAGQNDAFIQAIAKGDIEEQDITKEWDATGDSRTRTDHLVLDGQKVAFNGLFTAPDGSKLAYPGDSTHGAAADQVIQCRCRAKYKVDYLGQAMRGFG